MSSKTPNLRGYDSGKFASIQECIDFDKDNPVSLANNVMLLNYENIIQLHQSHLLNDYYNIIFANLIDSAIREDVFYYPERVSQVAYGTTDLWWLILFCNHMSSVFDFNRKSIKMFDPERLSLLNRIIKMNEKKILDNNENIPFINDLTLKRF